MKKEKERPSGRFFREEKHPVAFNPAWGVSGKK